MNNAFPVIRLEIQGMKHAILAALADRQLSLDSFVQAELDRQCSDGNISAIVQEATERYVREAIDNEVRKFFACGDGRAAIRAAVLARLNGKADA